MDAVPWRVEPCRAPTHVTSLFQSARSSLPLKRPHAKAESYECAPKFEKPPRAGPCAAGQDAAHGSSRCGVVRAFSGNVKTWVQFPAAPAFLFPAFSSFAVYTCVHQRHCLPALGLASPPPPRPPLRRVRPVPQPYNNRSQSPAEPLGIPGRAEPPRPASASHGQPRRPTPAIHGQPRGAMRLRGPSAACVPDGCGGDAGEQSFVPRCGAV